LKSTMKFFATLHYQHDDKPLNVDLQLQCTT